MSRAAGLLLHPTSLPGRFGVGDLGPEADAFLDWAAAGGQTLWQVMPLGPSGAHGSPYTASSAFAGSPLLVSPERLRDERLLTEEELRAEELPSCDHADLEDASAVKERLLRKAWERARHDPRWRGRLAAFREAEAWWLDDWTLFAALAARFGTEDWPEWDPDLAAREPAAVDRARRELADEIDHHAFVQLLFSDQWEHVRARARDRGIAVFGDVPIYVAFGSADVWAHRHLFSLDESGRPSVVAGVPPDYFSPTGQLWGNPLFRWDVLEETGYAWWLERLRRTFRLHDLVRIDHFRGFVAYWEVPARDETAIGGRWVPGPGDKLFAAADAALGALPIVAEDLGDITPDVKALLAELGFPGMRILQFAFGDVDSTFLPHNLVRNCVIYTGTHDNDTSAGWFASLGDALRRRVLSYVGGDGSDIAWDLIRVALTSIADRAIVPIQDVFSLGSEARMNRPGEAEGNWTFRARKEHFTDERAARLKELVEVSSRQRRDAH